MGGADERRVYVADPDREEGRRLRGDDFFSEPELAVQIYMPIRFLHRALSAFGYTPDGKGGFLAPDGAPSGNPVEAIQAEIVAAALAGERGSRSPEDEALEHIAGIATVLAGQLLLAPPDRIRLLSSKLQRIHDVAVAGRPDEDAAPPVAAEVGD